MVTSAYGIRGLETCASQPLGRAGCRMEFAVVETAPAFGDEEQARVYWGKLDVISSKVVTPLLKALSAAVGRRSVSNPRPRR